MKYKCKICGYVYDDSKQKVPFAELPDTWRCPLCGASKSDFEPMAEVEPQPKPEAKPVVIAQTDMKELSFGALSSVCSNLARGCEKQYLTKEAEQYRQLADYFLSIAKPEPNANYDELIALVNKDLDSLQELQTIATQKQDRGALRVKTWGEKVTSMLASLLKRYDEEGEEMLDNTNVWVCSICGFIYIGDNPPELCPVCKVQSDKFIKCGGDE